jgi:AmiR/NasT family two-component response regulator
MLDFSSALSFEPGETVFTAPMYRVSALLARSKGGGDATINQVVRALRSGGVLRWLNIRVSRADISNNYEFALPTQGDSEVLARGAAEFEGVVAAVDIVVPAIHQVDAPLFSNFLAQQLALFVRQCDLRDKNEALREETRATEETVALRKFMDRAKSLIVNHHGYTPDEAEEWLIGASVRHGKPLLSVAREIVTALSTLGLGVETAA